MLLHNIDNIMNHNCSQQMHFLRAMLENAFSARTPHGPPRWWNLERSTDPLAGLSGPILLREGSAS